MLESLLTDRLVWGKPERAPLHCEDVCVYLSVCLQPHTVTLVNLFQYFTKLERPCESIKATAKVQSRQPGSKDD